MSNRRYWGVGGEYRDTSFRELCDGAAQAFGPFPDYDQALRVWRERSVASRPLSHVRFTIAVNTTA